MLVQIYGVTNVADARAVAELGPDHVGVVLDERVDTWDSVDEATALAIVANLRGVKVVALSLSTDRGRILRTVEVLSPHILHLARAAGYLHPDALAQLRRDIRPLELMITVPVRGPESVATALGLAPSADFLLLDTVHPDSGVIGATGHTHDWSVSAQIVAALDVPVFLAGGLGPENLAQAIERVRPAGVDSETRTSRDDDRRRKDLDKVRQFIEIARSFAC